jgi:hypothetical protein
MKLSQLTTSKWGVTKRPMHNFKESIVRLYKAFTAQGKLYQVKKHSTRSKYRGYYIVELKGSIVKREKKVAKNLTEAQAVAWIKLLKG